MNPEELLRQQIAEEKIKLGLDKEEGSETKSETESENLTQDLNSESTPETTEDPFLKDALDMGYDPNYSGQNRKTPEQFVRDGSFFRKIDSQKKQINELTTLVTSLVDHNKKVEKASAEKAIKELQTQKREAIINADIDTFNSLEIQERQAKEQLNSIDSTVNQSSAPKEELKPEAKEFIERNSEWFNDKSDENKLMAAAAAQYEQFKLQTNPNKPYKEVLKETEDFIRTEFSHRFKNPNTEKPSIVLKSTTSSSVTKSDIVSKLSSQQKQFLEMSKKHGLEITAEEYYNQLKLTGDLKDE